MGRGGGSIEDLWAFNVERVAHAIYDSEIPVISAVGHEPDVTISDFVADRRASTPSNAAEIAVPDMAELLRGLQNTHNRMVQAELNLLDQRDQRLSYLAQKRALTDPTAFLQDKKMYLDYIQQRLGGAARQTLEADSRRFAHLTAKLDAMSPLKVLGRGYAMAQSEDGTVLRSVQQVSVGDKVSVQLAEGTLRCTVNEKGE